MQYTERAKERVELSQELLKKVQMCITEKDIETVFRDFKEEICNNERYMCDDICSVIGREVEKEFESDECSIEFGKRCVKRKLKNGQILKFEIENDMYEISLMSAEPFKEGLKRRKTNCAAKFPSIVRNLLYNTKIKYDEDVEE